MNSRLEAAEAKYSDKKKNLKNSKAKEDTNLQGKPIRLAGDFLAETFQGRRE